MSTAAKPKSTRQRHASAIPPTKAAYSVKEVCAALGISRPTVYKLIQTGQLRTLMSGRRRLIPVTEVDRFLDGAA